MKFSIFHNSPYNCSGVVSRGQTHIHDIKVVGLLDLENEGITKRREQFSLSNDTTLKFQKFWIFMSNLIGAYL